MNQFFKGMVEMTEESDRTHRGMVEVYTSEVEAGLLSSPTDQLPTGPKGRGLFKARFFAALCMVVAYGFASVGDESGIDKLLQAASGLSIEPLMEGGDVHLSRNEAEPIASSYVSHTMPLITKAINQAPVTPQTSSAEFDALAEQLHEALADSIGTENYTSEVRNWFDIRVRGNCANALNHAAKWASS